MLTISVSDTLVMLDLASQLPGDDRVLNATTLNYLRRYLNDVTRSEA